MNGKQLKKSVLNYAFSGKLSERQNDDSSVEKLLNEIKVVKNEEFPNPREINIDIDIPPHWKWVLLEDVTVNKDSQRVPLSKAIREQQKNKKYPYYGASGIIDHVESYLFDEPLLLIGEDGANLINRSTPIAFIADGKYWVNNHAHVLGTVNYTLMKYLMHYINSISLIPYITGTAQPKMNQKKMNSIPVPLPPIEEQERIITFIEKLFLKIDIYENNNHELNNILSKFPTKLENSILHFAVQGKLVKQDPSDKPAADLIESIREERKRLVVEKGIKKEKALPPITDEEIPFDIPESWEWVRLGEIGRWNAGATPSRSRIDYYNGDIPWLKTGDLNDDYIDSVTESITKLALKETSVKLIPKDSVLMAMYGATIGKLGILNIEATTNQACCACIPFKGVDNKYLFYYLKEQRKSFIEKGAGGAQPNISREKIIRHLIPLPPLNEQKRIVNKIEESFSIIEKIK